MIMNRAQVAAAESRARAQYAPVVAQLVTAARAALLRLDHHDEQSAPESLQLRAAIARAEGTTPPA